LFISTLSTLDGVIRQFEGQGGPSGFQGQYWQCATNIPRSQIKSQFKNEILRCDTSMRIFSLAYCTATTICGERFPPKVIIKLARAGFLIISIPSASGAVILDILLTIP
jgi:hypothetical protein